MSETAEQETIVVIDDDYAMRLSCRKILSKMGFRVEAFEDGGQASDVQQVPDVGVYVDQLQFATGVLGGHVGCKDGAESGAIHVRDIAQVRLDGLMLRRQALDLRLEPVGSFHDYVSSADEGQSAVAGDDTLNGQGVLRSWRFRSHVGLPRG